MKTIKMVINLVVISSLLMISCGKEKEDFIDKTETESEIDTIPPPNSGGKKVFSSYIRPNFYENHNRVPDQSLTAYNDLILIAFEPYTDGSIHFDLPDNQAGFSNVDYLPSFNGRNGVVDFQGSDADMDAGPDLLNEVRSYESDGSFKQFTFGTWVYIDEWTPGAFIFKKENNNGFIYCKMGDTAGVLEFNIDGNSVEIQATGFGIGEWHHFALAFHGNKDTTERVAGYIDGVRLDNVVVPPSFPTAVPFFRAPFHIGVGMDAKLDETFISSLYLSNGAISNYMEGGISLRNTDWNSTKTLAYWTYDDPSDPGEDLQSWKAIYDDVRSTIAGKDIELRMGIKSGDWKTMIKNDAYRTNFVNSVFEFVSEYNWDGVDLDFEWSYTDAEFSDYSQTIVQLGQKLAPLDVTFSVSLHPVSYKISQAAIAATDFISLQIYGPRPYLFSYDTFVTNAEEVVNYGIPKEKLVLGVPFYGVESNGEKLTQAYVSFVNAGLITSPGQDEVVYNGKSYTFNGQNTIRKKVKYVKQKNYLGIMTWDIATDASFVDDLSLTKTVYEELNQ